MVWWKKKTMFSLTLGRVSLVVAMSIPMMYVCWMLNVPSLWNLSLPSVVEPLVEQCIPNISMWWHNFQYRGVRFLTLGSLFLRLPKRMVLDQPTVDNGRVSRGRSVATAVGCWLLNGPSMALQKHFNRISTVLQRQKNGICDSIRIGRESVSPVWRIF